MIEVRRSEGDWYYVECDCGYYAGPFDGQSDAYTDGLEHDCLPGTNPQVNDG